MGRLGCSPLFLALVAATVFYAFALVRRVPLALEALSLSLLALAVVGPTTLNLERSRGHVPQPQPTA